MKMIFITARIMGISSLMLFVSTALQGKDMIATDSPKAQKQITEFHEHGQKRVDPYYWMNQRDTPQVLAYLKEENAYTNKVMHSTEKLQATIFEELKNRIKEDNSTVPVKLGNYYYYARYEKGKSYPLYCRKKENLTHPEEIILDVNDLAKSHAYYDMGSSKISPNENLLAYAEDTQGRRKYTIKFKDLSTGKDLADRVIDTTPNFEWSNDSKTLFYTKQDATTLRADKILKHTLGDQAADKTIFEEKDDAYSVDIQKTKSKQYLLIGSYKKNTTEFQFLDANNPDDTFKIFSPRKEGLEYYIEHHLNHFIIRTNLDAPNFKIMQCDTNKTAIADWQALGQYHPDIYIDDFHVFKDFYVTEQRKQGLDNIVIHPFNGDKPYNIAFDESDYTADVARNPEYDSQNLRYIYSSLKTPTSVYDLNVKTKQKELKKQDEVLGGFDANHYQTERIYAKAHDGIEIPISLVYRKDKFVKDKNPLLLAGYGSYGLSYDAEFNPYVISLLDRGFVYAIAHIRGGSELGRQWYYDGKLLKKKNTFKDFISAAEYLQKTGYVTKDKLYAIGGSAGGLLMGAVINMQPELFKGIVSEVPFVDMMNTMLDPSIPLTTEEYIEWGNPQDLTYYQYMMSYSPYDNIKAEHYPNILVTAAYHDSQVQYWEAAKWVAKLRDLKKDNHLLLFRTYMNASHSGMSGRYEQYKDRAFVYAFLIGLEHNQI